MSKISDPQNPNSEPPKEPRKEPQDPNSEPQKEPQDPNSEPPKEPQDLQIRGEQVQKVIDGISDLLHGRKITEALIIRVIANCMVITARMKVQNHLKKKIVILALEKYIRERSDLSQDEIDALMAIVDVVVADTIDTIADVKKGNIDLSTKTCCVIM